MESIGAAAGVLQVAQIGVELSKGLYKFAADFKHSKRTLERIAEDIHVLAIVLEQVDDTIKSASWLIKSKALEDFSKVLNGTNEAFKEVRDLLDSIGDLNAGGKLPFSKRAQWALSKKDKMDLLRANLAQLKASLDLMLHVLQLSIGTRITLEDRETINSLRADIERIHNEKQKVKEQYDQLLGQQSAAMFSLPHSANPELPPKALSAMSINTSKESISKNHDSVLAGLTLCAYAVANLSQTINTACVTWQDDGAFDSRLIRNHLDRAIQAVDILLSDRAIRQPHATPDAIFTASSRPRPNCATPECGISFSNMPPPVIRLKDAHKPRSSPMPFGKSMTELEGELCSFLPHTVSNQIGNQSGSSPAMAEDLCAKLVGKPQMLKRPDTRNNIHVTHQPSALPRTTSSAPIKYTRTGRISKASKGQRMHHCDECGKSYVRAEHLRRHQQNHKPGSFPCDFAGCGRSFHREDLLNRHKAHHGISYMETGRRPQPSHETGWFSCDFTGCGRAFHREDLLNRHKLEHKISYVETSRRHQRYHETDWFSCDFAGCGRSFHREDLLNRHKAQHNVSYVETGRRHQRYHETDWFSCDFAGCGRSFHREDLLNRHKAQHRYPLPPVPPQLEPYMYTPFTCYTSNTPKPVTMHQMMLPPIHVQDQVDNSQGEISGSNRLNTGDGSGCFTNFSPLQPALIPSTAASDNYPDPFMMPKQTIPPNELQSSNVATPVNYNLDSERFATSFVGTSRGDIESPYINHSTIPANPQLQSHVSQFEIDSCNQFGTGFRPINSKVISRPPGIPLEPGFYGIGVESNDTRAAVFQMQEDVVDKLLQEWTVV